MDVIWTIYDIVSGSLADGLSLALTALGIIEGLGIPVKWIWWTLLVPYLLFSITYVYYCAVIKLKSVWPDLHWIIKALVVPHAVLGLFLDVLVNVVIGTVLGLELPREWLFTARLKRWRYEEEGWRETVAIWLCEKGLNPIDPLHC